MHDSYFNLKGPEKVPWSLREELISILIWTAGYVEDILREHCPRFEYSVAIAIGCVAVVSTILNAVLFGIAAHALFNSVHFNFWLALAGIVFALTIATMESYGGRALQVPGGAKDLRSGGLAFPLLRRYTGSVSRFGAYRFAIALLTALVTTTGVSLQWLAPDIAVRQSRDVRDGNHAIYQQADQAYEREFQRMSDAEVRQSALVSDLEREEKRFRQEAVRRSVVGSRSRAAAGSTVDTAQLEKFEKRLAGEKSTLAKLREQSLKQVEGRNAAITQMIDTSSEKTQRQDGLIGRLSTLHTLLLENPSGLVIVIAIDLLLALLDCSGFIVRLCAPTSVYSAFVAKMHILGSVDQAKNCADRLSVYQTENAEPEENEKTAVQHGGAAIQSGNPPINQPTASNGNHPLSTGMNGAALPRRGRGRPRKPAPESID